MANAPGRGSDRGRSFPQGKALATEEALAGFQVLRHHVVEQVRPENEGIAALGDAGLDRQVQGAGGADGQTDASGKIADLGYQQPAGGGRVGLGHEASPPLQLIGYRSVSGMAVTAKHVRLSATKDRAILCGHGD
jgi:hypothetical protein